MKKSMFFLIILIFLFCFLIVEADAFIPYQNYTYNFFGDSVSAPPAYIPEKIISSTDLDIKELSSPRDLYVQNNKIYVVDTGNNRLLILDDRFNLEKIISEFEYKEKKDTFSSPQGIFVTEDGTIYVADTGNRRILQLSNYNSTEVINVIEKPQEEVGEILGSDYKFYPEKVGVDEYNRIYVVARATYDGIMRFEPEGEFEGFMGAPEVTPNPIDLFWHSIATEEQREKRALNLPIEFKNLDIDTRGFIYTINPPRYPGDQEIIKRLNPTGEDRLKRRGFHPIVGDLRKYEDEEADNGFYNRFSDIIARDERTYTVLCQNTGRLYTYGGNGNLLYVFGGKGTQKGLFQNPSALAELEDKILVLDRRENNITVFKQTRYAQLIHQAINYYNNGLYELASQNWKQVLELNNNFSLAYRGLALSNFRANNYKTAMYMSKMSEDRDLYSDIFTYYRQNVLKKNFDIVIYFLIFIMLVLLGFNYIYNKNIFGKHKKEIIPSQFKNTSIYQWLVKILSDLKFALIIIFHPFSGFWELKNERKRIWPTATIILGLTVATYLFFRQYSAFIFREWDVNQINIYQDILSILIPFFLWCVVNWSFTTLMEGKGTIKDIYVATSYSLVPTFLINIPLTIIGHYLTLEEESFYLFFITLSFLWFLILLFSSTMITHEYSPAKTVITIIFIIVGLGMSLFLILLFINLVNMLVGFSTSVYKEIFIR
ncbi:MAG: YIP1 family protein [bacterium]